MQTMVRSFAHRIPWIFIVFIIIAIACIFLYVPQHTQTHSLVLWFISLFLVVLFLFLSRFTVFLSQFSFILMPPMKFPFDFHVGAWLCWFVGWLAGWLARSLKFKWENATYMVRICRRLYFERFSTWHLCYQHNFRFFFAIFSVYSEFSLSFSPDIQSVFFPFFSMIHVNWQWCENGNWNGKNMQNKKCIIYVVGWQNKNTFNSAFFCCCCCFYSPLYCYYYSIT